MSLNDFLEENPQFKGMRRNLEMEEIQVKRFEKIIQELAEASRSASETPDKVKKTKCLVGAQVVVGNKLFSTTNGKFRETVAKKKTPFHKLSIIFSKNGEFVNGEHFLFKDINNGLLWLYRRLETAERLDKKMIANFLQEIIEFVNEYKV